MRVPCTVSTTDHVAACGCPLLLLRNRFVLTRFIGRVSYVCCCKLQWIGIPLMRVLVHPNISVPLPGLPELRPHAALAPVKAAPVDQQKKSRPTKKKLGRLLFSMHTPDAQRLSLFTLRHRSIAECLRNPRFAIDSSAHMVQSAFVELERAVMKELGNAAGSMSRSTTSM